MLILEQYGVRLIRLQEEDIELIRNWRNKNDVSDYMEYRKHITPEEQKTWFNSINNKYNYYFIIEFKNKKVGLINVKNYNPELGFGEGGIFIGEPDYIDSFAAVYSTLCLLNFIFFKLNLKKSRARILKNNPGAINYNKAIGYKLLPGQESIANQLYELSLEDYLKHAKKLNRIAALLNIRHSRLRYSGSPGPENIEEINALLLKET